VSISQPLILSKIKLVMTSQLFTEGAVSRIAVNAFERSPAARAACLIHHGYDCSCCGFNFQRTCGSAGANLIHVHHLVPFSAIREGYTVDPVRDLVPVCANCHVNDR
jgi:5-methylcytosine-specific restriction protein A